MAFKMWALIEKLKDPYLVLLVQNYFGVVSVPKRKVSNPDITSDGFTSEALCENHSEHGLKSSDDDKKPDESYSDSDNEKKNYVIKNWIWYYLFVLGTGLGDELFYATFIPFWFWNIDGAVGRRVVMVWTTCMYIGQGLKDIVCWPRPSCPPVFRLQKKWSAEYGMPSTHAMVGVAMPFSILLYTWQRYQYPILVGLTVALLWCAVVCISRIYLGMHSLIDIVAGLVLVVLIMVPVVPLVDMLDMFILTSRWSPPLLLTLSILLIVFAPKSNIWTPTRGDTAIILSTCVGIQLGAWTNYRLGQMTAPSAAPPYEIIWPSYEMMGLMFLRCALGFSCLLATRALCKSACFAVLCFLGLANIPHSSPTSRRNTIELSFKYITYFLFGYNTSHLLPSVFKLLSIDRPTFYTEI